MESWKIIKSEFETCFNYILILRYMVTNLRRRKNNTTVTAISFHHQDLDANRDKGNLVHVQEQRFTY